MALYHIKWFGKSGHLDNHITYDWSQGLHDTQVALYLNLYFFHLLTVYKELMATRHFDVMDLKTDKDEHSIEMHLPYTAKIMERWTAHVRCCEHLMTCFCVLTARKTILQSSLFWWEHWSGMVKNYMVKFSVST